VGRAAAAELGVRYALEGSVRRAGDKLRVTAQLLDVTAGTSLWAERYDGVLADVFSFQDRITQSVVGVIEPTIRQAEIERARRKPAANVDAYDLYLRALPLVYAAGPEGHVEALDLLGRAAALDPGFALPRAYAALVYETRMSLRAPPLGDQDVETGIALARAALRLAGDDPLVRAVSGYVLYRLDDDVRAIEALRSAVRDNPNHAAILTHAADGVGMHGCLEESIEYHTRAYTLSPGSTLAYTNLWGIAGSNFALGNYQAAIDWSLRWGAAIKDMILNKLCFACY
jgi:tetratricopeptide (TPR) repeat protein